MTSSCHPGRAAWGRDPAGAPLGSAVRDPEEHPAMRRTLLPAAAVLLALTSCASHEEDELREDLAAATGTRTALTRPGEAPCATTGSA